MWDWRTGYNFQRAKAPVQPGSLDSENGVFALAFDKSESRLVTCEADKTIKIYKEDEEAVCTIFHFPSLPSFDIAGFTGPPSFSPLNVCLRSIKFYYFLKK